MDGRKKKKKKKKEEKEKKKKKEEGDLERKKESSSKSSLCNFKCGVDSSIGFFVQPSFTNSLNRFVVQVHQNDRKKK